MKKFIAAIFVLTFVLSVAETYALDLGNEITIYDNKSRGGYSGWWNGSTGNGTANEDQEVEPGMQRGQVWDLEGFFLDGQTLSMVGGFDFIKGHHSRTSGDLFFDTTGDVKFGKDAPKTGLNGHGNKNVKNIFGYDYVLDLDFEQLSYSIYKIDSNADLTMGYYRQNDSSTAWKYSGGGEFLGNGTIVYQENLSDDAVGFQGGYHNVATFDLSFLYPETSFTSHFTMGCGNDNLMGYGTTPEAPVPTPEPGTLFLLGAGMVGLVAFVRKHQK